MPRNPVADAQHVVFTDHSIPRRRRSRPAPAADSDLVAFGGFTAPPRDIALAHAIAASREGGAARRPRAIALLQESLAKFPDDIEALLYVADFHRDAGRFTEAAPLYERALRLDSSRVAGLVGLGGVRMERGDDAGAVRLWEDALARNSGLLLVRTNLAMAYSCLGDNARAIAHLERALAMNPGFPAAAELLGSLIRR